MARQKQKSLLPRLKQEVLHKLRTSAAAGDLSGEDPFVKYRQRHSAEEHDCGIETFVPKKKTVTEVAFAGDAAPCLTVAINVPQGARGFFVRV